MRAFGNAVLNVITGTLVLASCGFTQSSSPATVQKESRVTKHARGTFEVKLTPQPSDDRANEDLGRMTIEKQLHGDLEGAGKGQMLTAGNSTGSGAYVAIERITGTLEGRSGSFILQHRGIMTRGTPDLSITVVPDSGTGQLAGITGTFTIILANGKHSYDFEYTLPQAQ
ncbi:MAG TPA: DUF3224 domain-containing protein [Candidatus Angelobacter sp.]